MNVCTAHGDAHHWEDDWIDSGYVRQSCACGNFRYFPEEPEPADLVQGDAKLRGNSGDADATENHPNGSER